MGDDEHLQPSKKRVAGRQLTKDHPELDDEETSELEMGSFKKASDEVLASRRIVKVRRNTTAAPPSAAASSNPFGAIRLVPPTDTQTISTVDSTEAESGKSVSEKVEEKSDADLVIEVSGKQSESDAKVEPTREEGKTLSFDETITRGNLADEKSNKDLEARNGEGETSKEIEEPRNGQEADDKALGYKQEDDVKPETEKKVGDEKSENSSFSSFQQLSSSRNAFTGLAGTGFSSSTFSFGAISKDGAVSGSLFGTKNDQPSFGIVPSSNGIPSLFGTSGSSIVSKKEGTGFPAKQEVSVETGEENEKAVFTADSVLFEYHDGGWKERGKGELKVNVSTIGTGKARLVMRTKGNYRLIMNASLYSDMKLTNMDKKGITFACINSASEGKDGLSTYALKFKDPSIVGEFQAAVAEHKGKAAGSLKTPENSPKENDD